MKKIKIDKDLLCQIEEVIDVLIYVIDHDRDLIDSFTTRPARELLSEISKLG